MDEGYINLAGEIVRGQLKRYHAALNKYSREHNDSRRIGILRQITSIEHELSTRYYDVLTLGKIDFEEYIKYKHEQYGIKENVR